MARTATATELAQAQGRPIGFADVPEDLRPSRWRGFMPAVPADVTGHRERTSAAWRLRSDAYCAWLAAHDLVNKLGQPAIGWDSTTFARWEDRQ